MVGGSAWLSRSRLVERSQLWAARSAVRRLIQARVKVATASTSVPMATQADAVSLMKVCSARMMCSMLKNSIPKHATVPGFPTRLGPR